MSINSISSSKSIVCCISSDAARSRSSDVFNGSVLSLTIIVDKSVDAGDDFVDIFIPDPLASVPAGAGAADVVELWAAVSTYDTSTISNGASFLIFCTVRSICFFFLDSLVRRGLTGFVGFPAVTAVAVDVVGAGSVVVVVAVVVAVVVGGGGGVFFTLLRNFGITTSFSPVLWSTLCLRRVCFNQFGKFVKSFGQ